MGDHLYRTVEEYSALGDHRVGTAVDRATVDWFASRLESLGASVDRDLFEFRRYVAAWEVTIDGEPVVSIPLFYEGVGSVRSTAPAAGSVAVLRGTLVPDLGPITASARADGRPAVVVATSADPGAAEHGYADPGELLHAPNRWADRDGSGVPTLCVAGSEAEGLTERDISVSIDARLEPGNSENVIARIGDAPDHERVLLTTPLSGWFSCAGERGTGIAVCLAVAAELSRSHPVLVLGTNGHELMGLGVKHHAATRAIEARGILHFGASVASGNSDGVNTPVERSPGVIAQGWAGSERRAELAGALAPFRERVRLPDALAAPDRPSDQRGWLGESALWAGHGRPVVSIAGGFPLHHAPEDRPALATSPTLLAQSFGAALAAARILASYPPETAS